MPKITYLTPKKLSPLPVKVNRRQELLKRYIKGRKLTYDKVAPMVGIKAATLRWKFSEAGIDSITAKELFSLITALSIPLDEVAEAWGSEEP